MDVPVRNFNVLMENAFPEHLSVTTMMIVEIGVMKTLAVCWLCLFCLFIAVLHTHTTF